MPKKDRTLSPQLDYTVKALRIEGLSERAIYEQLREHLAADVPSYRDIRASLSNARLRYRKDAELARKRVELPADLYDGQRAIQKMNYEDRLSTLRRVDRRAGAKDDLDRAYTLGFLARSGIEPELIQDESMRESLVNIYDGVGS